MQCPLSKRRHSAGIADILSAGIISTQFTFPFVVARVEADRMFALPAHRTAYGLLALLLGGEGCRELARQDQTQRSHQSWLLAQRAGQNAS